MYIDAHSWFPYVKRQTQIALEIKILYVTQKTTQTLIVERNEKMRFGRSEQKRKRKWK